MGSVSSPAWQAALSHCSSAPPAFFQLCPLSREHPDFSRNMARENTPKWYFHSSSPFTPLELLWATVAGMLKVSQMPLPSGMRHTASWLRWLFHSCGTGRLPWCCVQLGRAVEGPGGQDHGRDQWEHSGSVLCCERCFTALTKCVPVFLQLGLDLQESRVVIYLRQMRNFSVPFLWDLSSDASWCILNLIQNASHW